MYPVIAARLVRGKGKKILLEEQGRDMSDALSAAMNIGLMVAMFFDPQGEAYPPVVNGRDSGVDIAGRAFRLVVEKNETFKPIFERWLADSAFRATIAVGVSTVSCSRLRLLVLIYTFVRSGNDAALSARKPRTSRVSPRPTNTSTAISSSHSRRTWMKSRNCSPSSRPCGAKRPSYLLAISM